MITHIIKRNGEKKTFDQHRIYKAIEKAFQSENINNPETVMAIMNASLSSIDVLHGKQHKDITVEEVQDIVEKELMMQGYHSIARSYILYREQQSRLRQEKTFIKVQEKTLKVKVSDTEFIVYNPKTVEDYLRRLSFGLYKVSISEMIDAITKQIYDEIPQLELDQLILGAARERIETHYQYSSLSSRIILDRLYTSILGAGLETDSHKLNYQEQFETYIKQGISFELLNPELVSYDFQKLSKAIDYKRDYLFHFLGIQILVDRYFIRNRDLKSSVIELPQWFWMRVSMGLALKEDESIRNEKAIEFYHVLSNMDLVSSTPTLFNSGTRFSQMSSCYLNTSDDSLEGIFKLFSDNAKLSKWAGGIGSDWTHVRATGSKIKGTNGTSQGVIPFIKIFNDVALAVNQGGKRKGAMCAYLEIWHMDIEQFFELRKNTGDERRRTHDINTACWIPDLFMKRVEEKGHWTLFCSADVPDLHDLTGSAFEAKYCEYEADSSIRQRVIPAAELWRKLLTMLYETGHPWVTFKDPCNIRSPQDHVGVVHSSNLCTEITLNTSGDETAVCNLASLNLAHMIKDGELDKEKIERTVSIGIRMLDNVIDNNYYPTVEAERANFRHRAIGLGLMGYQDALYQLNIDFESDENLEFADASMEMISYFAILASSMLAKERGSYETFKGSKWDRDIFPLDTLAILEKERGQDVDVDRITRLDWQVVRDHVKTYGMRNSNVMAIAPTATIANISGVYPCTEPAYKNMYMKENLSGNFFVINRYLVDDLDALDLWNTSMVKQIKLNDGSIAKIAGIPESFVRKYKETFEVDMHWVLRSAAKRMKWIDQSASTNIFLTTQSGKVLSETYTLAWKLGLKTTYYLRTLAATQVTKATVQESDISEPLVSVSNNSKESVGVCSILDPDCEACQ
ncbi:ribonucleoside-diphosphate reductase subunit alpha [bacterium]|nr:ribonucleoside-diphosphate reductase subunit alpha [bacterium]|tara:strand:+ start:1992 stop:4727 length:2736 start_codon:yes stop_codon:yes gene_type:complete